MADISEGLDRPHAKVKQGLQQDCDKLSWFMHTFPLWSYNGKSRAALPKITPCLPSNGLHESLFSLEW